MSDFPEVQGCVCFSTEKAFGMSKLRREKAEHIAGRIGSSGSWERTITAVCSRHVSANNSDQNA